MSEVRAEVHHNGKRYWANFTVVQGGIIWRFWSSHKWPWYHGYYTQRVLDRIDGYRAFLEWLPNFVPDRRGSSKGGCCE